MLLMLFHPFPKSLDQEFAHISPPPSEYLDSNVFAVCVHDWRLLSKHGPALS